MKTIVRLGGCLAVALAVGCGSSALPPAKVTETQSAIAAAEAVGADSHPQGALHLKLARDQMQQANKLLRDGDDKEGRLVLERARVDAELALVLTRGIRLQSEVQQANQKVQELERNN